MSGRPRVEATMPLAAIAVLLAIGVPAWRRGEAMVGGACVVAAIAMLGWLAFVSRRGPR